MAVDVDLLLAWGATYKKITPGEIIFTEGNHCSFYHQLVNGSVKWMNVDEAGKEFIQTIVEPGESFGILPLFDDEPYAATAIAEKESLVLRLHKPVFLDLLRDSPELHFKFTRLLAEQVRFKLLLLKTISCQNPHICIATLLDYLKKHKKNICPDCSQLNLTRQQIAGMTGLRVETVIRTMRHMHDAGELLITKGKVFCIYD